MRTHAFVLSLVLPCSAVADPPPSPSDYWRDNWRGWHFYEEPAPEEPEPVGPPRQATAKPAPAPGLPPELLAFEQLQKSLEDLRRIAIMRPTESNVRRYMEIEARVVAQASTFADIAQRVAWSTPAVDPSLLGRPVNARALEVFEARQQSDRAQTVATLARDHVLIFFFRGDCPYCHAFAPTLGAFRARHGLKVLAITLDGGALPGFDDARRDNGIAANLQVTQMPALYLAQPFTGTITPVGHGVLSEAQLLERIAAVSTPIAASAALSDTAPIAAATPSAAATSQ